MRASSHPPFHDNCQRLAWASAAAAAVIAVAALAGWWFDLPLLRSFGSGRIAMNPGGTAVALLLSGAALGLLVKPTASGRRLGLACAAGVVLLSVLRFIGYWVGWDGGPDQFLFRTQLDQEFLRSGYTNRMAPNTAAIFLLIGTALLLLDVRVSARLRPSEVLTLLAAILVLLAAIGYAYSTIALAGVPRFIPMAPITTLAFALLCGGLLAARPNQGLMAVVTSSGPGGVMARRLIPSAILIPMALGWLRWTSLMVGWMDQVMGLSLFVLSIVVIFATLIWWSAFSLEGADRSRQRAARQAAAQNRAAAVLAESPQPTEAIRKILEALCDGLQWEMGLFWQVDASAGVLRHSAEWRRADSAAAFAALSQGMTFAAGSGLPGRVWAQGRPLWIRDVLQDHHLPRREALKAAALRTALGFPIAVGNETLGVMEFFSRDVEEPDEELLRTVAAIGSQIGQFLKRKQAEDAAAHARYLLDSLFNHFPDSIYFKDERSRFIRVSRAWAERHGLTNPDDAVGQTDFDYFDADHAQHAFADEQEVIASGRPLVGKEERESWADGRERWATTTKMPLRDPAGHIVGTFGISRDITVRKQAEEALRQGEERFRCLVEATSAIVWRTPASGEFEDEQPGWTAYTGQTFEQHKGGGWLEAVHPDDRANTARVWSASVATRSLYQVEHRLRRHDGVYRHMLARAVPILARGGGIREWIGIHTDVDAEKKAEALMREAKETALAATRAKSEFLANMSHEIRTPLNGIVGMTELALDTELSPEQREYLGMVRMSADHLLNVINEILDFSKIEAGRLDLECIDFDLRDTLDDTVATLAARAHKKGLELADDVANDIPDAVAGDPHRLRQVLVNLIGNAIKFTDRGEVVLRVRKQEVENCQPLTGASSADSIVLHFEVSDTGIGIAPEQREKLFQAFTQADTSTTRKYGGTGLGLAISSRLVEMMGGRMWLESEAGRGSTFHFTVPFAPARGPRSEKARPDQVRGLPVLVVDDNATNRRILQELLRNWGMCPTVVDGGSAALQALGQAREGAAPFALVLLDAMMPDMDGFTLAERIQHDPGLVGATLMMLSSAGQREDAARCRALGVAAYLTKPIRQSTLLDSIMTALGPTAVPSGRALPERPAWGPCPRRLHVLLAEDNAVNQTLAVRLLEKRGHNVLVVGTGRAAVEALQRERFDAVLMDVQMPEMDGFEATAAIRARERPAGMHTPVIAMTAHALKGDREHCLEAGMDGYVSKPLRPEDLFATLEGLANGASIAPENERQAPSMAPVFNKAAALERTGGDEELLKELAALCVAESPSLLREIETAIAQHDGPKLRLAAHTLKGSVGTFAAEDAYQAAWRLEQVGRDASWADAEGAWAALRETVGLLMPALEELANESHTKS